MRPIEIKKYVNSLKESAVHWFNSHYPYLATELTAAEQNAIDRLNRIGMGYFRPLVMSFFTNEKTSATRIEFLDQVERFIFVVFRLCQARRNYRDSEFYNAARELDKAELKLEGIKDKLKASAAFCFREDGSFNAKYFYDYLYKRFNSGGRSGYYGWHGLRYFLYEYEVNLLSQSRQQKITWDDLLKTSKDKISIEHIFPQTPTDSWKGVFSGVVEDDFYYYSGSIGNLLLLSMSINSSLQNDTFDEKKHPKIGDSGEKIRNGYSDGSHSEIEVSKFDEWNSAKIEERGLQLLNFMEKRWDIKFKDEEDKKTLLFLDTKDESADD